mgnify:CR=1 FL=1
MGIGPGDGDRAGFQWLAQTVEHLGMKFRQFVQEQHTAMGERSLARPGAHAPADHRRHRSGVMRRAEGPGACQPAALEQARDRVDHRDVQQFFRRQRW